jgi:hypothetical protein
VWLQSVGSFTLKRVTHWRPIGPLPGGDA